MSTLIAEAAGERMLDYVELTKPRITLMVVLTAAVGFIAASGESIAALTFVHAIVGTGLLAGGAASLNMVVEREIDARMRRTADRPLPAGRLSPETALRFGVLLSIAGVLYLAFLTNRLTALLGAVTLASYVWVYTPLKRRTSLATLVGAVPGALPPVMGWAAASGVVDAGAAALFALLFLWQLPHFLAIAWLYREDYTRGGFPLLTTRDIDGSRTGRQMVLYCAALIPVSLLPAALGFAGGLYLLAGLACGVAFLVPCLGFVRQPSPLMARRVLLVSVAYLPAILLALVLDRTPYAPAGRVISGDGVELFVEP
jgi:protoheme IX farnesyltransferase